MRNILRLVMVIVLGALVACEQRFEDVSRDPRFEKVVGSGYVVVGAVDGYGIRQHSKAEVEYITLIPPPGIEGPEVGFRVPISPGSRITVLKVLRSNRWPDPNLTLIVKLDGTQMPVKKTIRIDLFRGNEGQGLAQLASNIYRKRTIAAQ